MSSVNRTPCVDCLTRSTEHTFLLGKTLGEAFIDGAAVGLVGPLGAGKTLLVKGIARGLGIEDDAVVTSPTFTLVQEYSARLVVQHIDVYRLNTARDFVALGIDEMIANGDVVLVEWADKVREVMPESTLWITMEPVDNTTRRISLAGKSPRWEPVLQRVKERFT